MYDRELYSKVVRFQRTAVDNTFAIFTTLQGYGEQILKRSLEQNPWLPEKSKSTCVGLSDTCLHGSRTLRKFIDQGFDEMERLVTQRSMPQKKEKPEPKAPSSRTAAATGQRASEKKAAAAHKSAGRSTSSESVGSTVKPQKQSTATPTGTTSTSTPASTPAAKPAITSTATPVAAAAPSPAPTSTATPAVTPAATMTKPTEPSDKTAKGGIATPGKPT